MLSSQNILAAFTNHGEPYTWTSLKERVGVKSADLFLFKKIMHKLFVDQTLLQSEAGLIYDPNWKSVQTGVIKINRKGFGFVTATNQPEQVYFVPPVNIGNALPLDKVYFVVQPSANEKYRDKAEGHIIGIKERYCTELIGITKLSYKQNMFLQLTQANFQHYRTSIINSHHVQPNHYYKAAITDFKQGRIFIKLIEDLGHESEVGIDILAVVNEFGIERHFDQATLEEAKNLPSQISDEMADQLIANGRLDLRLKKLVTIDGDDSKDFDDAVCVEQLANGNSLLTVAIADVAHYVLAESALDATAHRRGFSSYLIDQVIPMLPFQLSTGICSLNPNVNRLCMVCEIEYSPTGDVLRTNLYEGVMKSHARLTYRQVNAFLNNETSAGQSVPSELFASLKAAAQLYDVLWHKRQAAGFVEFAVKEPKFVLDEQKKIIKIGCRSRDKAEELIEAFMVAANEAVAATILKKHKLFIYRNHDKPQLESLELLTKQLSAFNYKAHFNPSQTSSKDFQNILQDLAKLNLDAGLLAPLFLRSMAKAKYQPFNIGHFGLVSNQYTHFTSPIRRYADLIVHRYLKRYLFGSSHASDHKLDQALPQICDSINNNEIKTTECERAVNQMKIAEYVHQQEGQIFEGQVAAVTKFGMFVQIENMIEGLVHVRDMAGDYYQYCEDNFTLVGSETKKVFKIGTKLKIKVKKADKILRQIDFELVA